MRKAETTSTSPPTQVAFFPGDKPTLAEVFGAIRTACRASGSQSAWAASIGITPQYLSDVLNCRRDPSMTILRAIGLRRVVTYVGMGKAK